MQTSTWLVGTLLLMVVTSSMVWPADPAVLKPRIPADQLASARQMRNPYPMAEGIIEERKRIFEGKGFCRTCHGIDGKGLGSDIEPENLRGPLPRNFTDKEWQAARTDGELFWILKHGSKGTAMASFIPLVLTEEDAWKVISYIRSFAQP